MSDEKREWLIRKGGYFYRPNCAGYTTRKIEAGRYTKAEAEREAAVEPWHMFALHESWVPDEPAVANLAARLAKAERALEEAEKVIKPFAEANPHWANYVPKIDDFRAARKWMESRPLSPKEGA